MLRLLLLGFVPILSACGGPSLTIINESSAWLRFQAASEVDPRQSSITGPLAGDGSVTFGVPPGARHEQDIKPGGSIFTRRRLGITIHVQASTNPAGSDRLNPSFITSYSVRLPPPGPYRLRFTGQPGTVEIFRVDAKGQPLSEDRATILPQSAVMWWGLESGR